MTYANLSEQAYQQALLKHRKPEPLFEKFLEKKLRKCLRCDVEFESTGDRCCSRCNELNRRGGRRTDKSVRGGSKANLGPS